MAERKLSRPWMKDEEIDAILALIKPTTRYLEWGSGGSTWTFAVRAASAHSIEHNKAWCNDVGVALKGLEATSVTLHCVTVEPGHLGWGGGFEEGTYDQFDEYINAVRVCVCVHGLFLRHHSFSIMMSAREC